MFKESPRISILRVSLNTTILGACKAVGLHHAHGSVSGHASVFPRWAPWQMMRSMPLTWAVSLLASGRAMTMRCKAWNCTLMCGPPKETTEIITRSEPRWCVLTAITLTSGGAGGLWQLRGKDAGLELNNVNLFIWTGAPVCRPLPVPWCLFIGR